MSNRVIQTILSDATWDIHKTTGVPGMGKIADVLFDDATNRYFVRCYKDSHLEKVIVDPTWIHEDAALDAAEDYINEE